MPNLLSYTFRSLKINRKNNNLKIPNSVKCLVVSPGGCGSVSLIKFLDKHIKSNIYIEKKYKLFGLSHLSKPPNSFIHDQIKIILIRRNKKSIYKSLKKRGFLRNTLSLYGDLFPYLYLNIFKNEDKFKKKFINYIKLFYQKWDNYPKDLIYKVDYDDLYRKKKIKHEIQKFLNIRNKKFLNDFPVYKKYKMNKNFIDPSSLKILK
tara:strand:- start:118 stop:735 length:618 start_codon:yes stop_codon:yes gene_type:complete